MSDTDISFDSEGKATADGWTKVYGYDYMGVLTAGYNVQLKKGMTIPAKTTQMQPPMTVIGSVAVFDKNAGAWSNQIDHRGETVYNKVTLQPTTVDYLGDYRSDVTPIKPPSCFYTWSETSGNWIADDTLTPEQQKAATVKAVTAELERAVQMISICEDKLQLSYFSNGETKDSVTATELLWKKYRLQCIDYINGVLTDVPDAPDSAAYAAAVKAAADEAAKEAAATEAAELQEEREEEAKAAAANSAATAETTGTESSASAEATATASDDSATDSTGTDSDTTTGETATTTDTTGTTGTSTDTTSADTADTDTTGTTETSSETTGS